MAEVLELTQFVEAHPDNYGERWRLAKKLYVAWEYRAALEHLLVLRNEWTSRLNVARYLAATYYRLSRFEDAVSELERALEEWPGELALREQLARALEVSGELLEASDIWERIVLEYPEHPFAKRAVKSLRDRALGKDPNRASAVKSIPSAAVTPEIQHRVCQLCGARNSEEFERCWQCHNMMESGAKPPVSVAPEESKDEEDRFATHKSVAAGLSVVGLLSAGLYLTLQQNALLAGVGKGSLVATSLTEYFLRDFLLTRIILGLVFLIVWPLALHLSLSLVGGDDLARSRLNVVGAFLAAVTYLVSWSPAYYGLAVVLVPLCASLVVIVFGLGLKFPRAIMVWSSQAVFVLLAGISVLAGLHGFTMVADLPILVRDSAREPQGQPATYSGTTPFEIDLQWQKSGSLWLDKEADSAGFIVETGPFERSLYLEVQSGGSTVEFEEIGKDSLNIAVDKLEPGRPYILSVVGQEGVEVSILVRSVHALATPAQIAQGNSKE